MFAVPEDQTARIACCTSSWRNSIHDVTITIHDFDGDKSLTFYTGRDSVGDIIARATAAGFEFDD